MKKVKLLIILLLVLCLCGCVNVESKNLGTAQNINYIIFNVLVDKETCVEYFQYPGCSLTTRYNADGTLKLNKECLNEK